MNLLIPAYEEKIGNNQLSPLYSRTKNSKIADQWEREGVDLLILI
jgi:hypothetical protein